MENKPLNILVSAYACGPNWGSEIGMGWNWIINLSNYCQLTVITERGFKEEIENKLPDLKLRFTPRFHYVDIGDEGRKLFWKQGSFYFYKYYRKWQKKVLRLSYKLINENEFDIIHQLNMIGFREPGFLWKIKGIPYILGPLGGIDVFPNSYLKFLPIRNRIFTIGKNIYSNVQFNLMGRFNQAGKRSDLIFAATKDGFVRLNNKFGNKVLLLNETGCDLRDTSFKNGYDGNTLKLLWVGRLEERKALPIALETIGKIKNTIDVELTIVGDGPLENYCKKMVKDLQIDNIVIWKGRISNIEVQNLMLNTSLLFFTSLREGTPHVVTEALQNGLPILCHDACGQGSVVNEKCGIKIEMNNPKNSINAFSKALIKLYSDKKLLRDLSIGAINRSKEISWDEKAKKMIEQYKIVLNAF